MRMAKVGSIEDRDCLKLYLAAIVGFGVEGRTSFVVDVSDLCLVETNEARTDRE